MPTPPKNARLTPPRTVSRIFCLTPGGGGGREGVLAGPACPPRADPPGGGACGPPQAPRHPGTQEFQGTFHRPPIYGQHVCRRHMHTHEAPCERSNGSTQRLFVHGSNQVCVDKGKTPHKRPYETLKKFSGASRLSPRSDPAGGGGSGFPKIGLGASTPPQGGLHRVKKILGQYAAEWDLCCNLQ